MDPLTANPFSVLTFIAAPAILTNAASVLGLSTSNRIARVVDRTRVLTGLLEKEHQPDDPEVALRLRELEAGVQRAHLLVKALARFYLAVGSFAAASLVSLLGMVLLSMGLLWLTRAAIGLALLTGLVGLAGITHGATLLVWETQLALRNLRETTQTTLQNLRILRSGSNLLPPI
jgi:hypothetical protein